MILRLSSLFSVALVLVVLTGIILFSTNRYVQAAPGDGISTTKHDFTTDANLIQSIGLCTFCHTPHKSLQQPLLWNHKKSTNTFSWTETATTGATNYASIAGGTYKGVTALCLSCHDGSVAIGDINWFNATGPAVFSTTTVGSAYQIASTGGDMTGNHPVAMPFPFGGATSTYNGITSGAAGAASGWQADPTANGIRLFADNAGTFSACTGSAECSGKAGIECSSCHDPHNKDAIDVFFLRGNLTGNDTNYICLKCHNK